MPDKHPNTRRWGGPGSNNQNAKQEPPPERNDQEPGTPTNERNSQVSTGGGERDVNHTHDPKLKN